ncbi:MAG TPA: polysaccharide biosynthesis/export family protein [Pyrinomonadaceae bacterium]|jgi:polysaccharide export outer membrane protein
MKKYQKLTGAASLVALLFASSVSATVVVVAAPQQAQEPSVVTVKTVTPTPSGDVKDAKTHDALTVTMTPQQQGKKDEKKPQKRDKNAVRPRVAAPTAERLEPDDRTIPPVGMPVETLANRREQLSEEEQAVVPYYNNFMTTYRLGPEDVISVRVFGQERYSIGNIVVPPDGTISYPLIPAGIFVAGKTTRQVAEEIAKHLDEYIIDPKVTVFLEKAMSARYGIVGDVAQPGIRTLTRRLTVYEALMEAGGVLSTGDKKKVVLVRQRPGPDGMLQQIAVNISAIEKGKAPNTQYISPGDQIFVPGNRMKQVDKILGLLPIISFARIFTGGF